MSIISNKLNMKFASPWQKMAVMRCVSVTVFIISSSTATFLTVYRALSIYAGVARLEDSAIWFLVTGLIAVLALVSGVENWRLYRNEHLLFEEPFHIIPSLEKRDDWLSVCSHGAISGSRDANELEFDVSCFETEFFINALMKPQTVFRRISEHMTPFKRSMSGYVDYEISCPSVQGMSVIPLKECLSGSHKEDCKWCDLLIPITFQQRGEPIMVKEVTDVEGKSIHVARQVDVAEKIMRFIDSYFEEREEPSKPSQWVLGGNNGLRSELRKYLLNAEKNQNYSLPEQVCEAMLQHASGSHGDTVLCRCVLEMLVGLQNAYPVCALLHVAVTKCVPAENSSPFVFKLRMEERCSLRLKDENFIPGGGKHSLTKFVNKLASVIARRSDTIYYNLSRAGRTSSYHLYLEGPEGTYYSRGSIIRQNMGNKRQITAEYVDTEERRGQRSAHIYIRSGQGFSETMFMFRYVRMPLDTFHIMFIAVALCAVVLLICALVSLNTNGDFAGSSVATMLLAVVSAASPWIYSRASDGKEDSLIIEVSILSTTACSILGMTMFFLLGNGQETASAVPVIIWSLLVTIMVFDTLAVGHIALLHSLLYRYVVDRPHKKCLVSESDIGNEVASYMRADTPSGRYVVNPYCLWVESVMDLKRKAGISI